MNEAERAGAIEARIAELAARGISLANDPRGFAGTHARTPLWQALAAAGTELWLDTGDLDEAARLWCGELSALTTNNTLLSKEVGKGIYDEVIAAGAAELRRIAPDILAEGLVREIGLMLNARHALRLVARFGCRVSVELHTDLAHDLDGSLAYARRLHALCPERFIIKVPLTPTGLLVARRLVSDRIPVNFTLEFSARQNFVAASVANPDFVNVFLGRLNAFVQDNGLGDGRMVGEKATLHSQRAISEHRARGGRTRQIAASMREASQVAALAGVDVFTMPTALAQDALATVGSESIVSQVGRDPEITVSREETRGALGKLWLVSGELTRSVSALTAEDLDGMTGEDLAEFLRRRGHGDLFPRWSAADLEQIAGDGKIPVYAHWRDALVGGDLGPDAALNAAGLASFASDQRLLDDRIRSLL